MCPPTASTPIDVDFASTDENLFGSLERMIRGCPLPCNVINNVNPYNYKPSDLPDGVWYLVCSKENRSAQHGRWKAKGEACEIFSNSFIIGWRTILEFYEGQDPHERKTDWVMQEFRITQKRLFEDKRGEVIDDNETRTLAVMERPINHPEDNVPDADYFSEGDFLELHDLDQPLSPYLSSDRSSCMTLSSDECFDPSAFLRELQPKKTEAVVLENAGYKYSFSTSHTPNDVVMSPGSLINIERSKPETEVTLKYECPMPVSATVNGALDSKVLKQAIQGQEANYGDEGPSSNSRNLTSSQDHSSLQNGEKKATVGRMNNLKRNYFRFMPF